MEFLASNIMFLSIIQNVLVIVFHILGIMCFIKYLKK